MEDALKHSSSSSPSPEPLHANNNNNNGMARNKLMRILASFCWHTLQTHILQLKITLRGEGSPAVTLN